MTASERPVPRKQRVERLTSPSPGEGSADDVYNAAIAAMRGDDLALCEVLELLAVRTGANKFRHAANILRGRTVGRKAIDDGEALRRIRSLPREDRPAAAGKMAKKLAGPGAHARKIESIASRLRRKLRKKTDETVLSAAPDR